MLAFLGVGLVRRIVVYFFPSLPYARIFTVGGIAFAVLFPICSYLLDKAFHLNLPLRYLFDLSILVLTYVMLGWGLNVVVGLAGLLDLGYVAFYAVGAYTFALLADAFRLGLLDLPADRRLWRPRCGASFSAFRCSGSAATISPSSRSLSARSCASSCSIGPMSPTGRTASRVSPSRPFSVCRSQPTGMSPSAASSA